MFVHPHILTANSRIVRHIDNFQRPLRPLNSDSRFQYSSAVLQPIKYRAVRTRGDTRGTPSWKTFYQFSVASPPKKAERNAGIVKLLMPSETGRQSFLPSFGGNAGEVCLSLCCFRVLNYCIKKTQNSCPMFFAAGEKLCVFRPLSLRKFDSTDGTYQTSCYVST